ncbi:MAG: T9SS type A sorting domain-containing protein, partial [Bacteroidota bacterium]
PAPLIHSVSPNPATDFIEINFEESTGKELTSLRISDMLGREFFPAIQLESGWANISTAGLANGMYLLELRQGANVETKKVMVERR